MSAPNETNLIEALEETARLARRLSDQNSQASCLFSAIARIGIEVDYIGLAEAGENLAARWMNEAHDELERIETKIREIKEQTNKAA